MSQILETHRHWPEDPIIGPLYLDLDPQIQEDAVQTIQTIDTVLQDYANSSRAYLAEQAATEEASQEKFYNFLGKVSVKQALEQTFVKPEAAGPTLASAIIEARNGDKEANDLVDINVSTAAAEAFFKAGHLTKIEKELNQDGEVVQFGATTENLQYNSVVFRPNRHDILKQFTLAEVQNGLREQELAKRGILKDYWFVVPSCVPENLPEELLDDRGDGYFTSSMTFAAQGTTQIENSKLITETVFDRGTNAAHDDDYQQRQAQRFDVAAIGKVYERFGLDAPESALDMLKNPLLISKTEMPNGMVDFWRFIDESKDELTGEIQVRTEQQYLDKITQSKTREDSLADVKLEVKRRLLAYGDSFKNDMQAIDTLWELVRKRGVKESVVNNHIDPIVFGGQAAGLIKQARYSATIGDTESVLDLQRAAEQVAKVSGCGGGAQGEKTDNPLDANDNQEAPHDDEDQYGSLHFKCPKGCNNRRPRGKLIENCQRCGTSVRC
jgi:hypothetical protein